VRTPTIVAVAAAVLTTGAIALVLGSSPGGAGAPTPVASVEAVTGTWEASEGPDAPAPLETPVRLTFGEGAVFVETGCNTGRAAATVEESRLVIGPLAATRKACPSPLDVQEAWVFDMLESTPSMELGGTSELTLSWGDDYELLLTRVADAPGTSPTPQV
jgi:heat shock protein HslJ